MEYAVATIVVAVFITVYLLTRPKIRAVYFDMYDDLQYTSAVKDYIIGLPLPKEGAKNNAKRYASTVKWIMRKIKLGKYCGFFDKFTAYEDIIKSVLKSDFAPLDELPSIDGEPRAVKIARFCLAHSNYNLDDKRIRDIIEAQNDRRTLSFSEIMSMNTAFKYVLLEKLCYIFLQLDTLAKIYMLAAKYVYNPVLVDAKYKKLTKSKLFLSICALRAGYRMEYFSKVHSDVTDVICTQLKCVLDGIESVEKYDFSVFYTPLEILEKYEVFAGASKDVKKNFLALIKEASDKENIDEFMYTIRLDKYMQSASAGHISVRRTKFLSRTLCVINQKRDISMLAAALGSAHFMNLYFADKGKNIAKGSKSISKMLEHENTFEPIYKFHTINFGISTSGGKLRISPSLPRGIERADIVFDAYGLKNSLHIERGDEKELYLGNTKICGVEQIKLGEKPIDVTVKIPREQN